MAQRLVLLQTLLDVLSIRQTRRAMHLDTASFKVQAKEQMQLRQLVFAESDLGCHRRVSWTSSSTDPGFIRDHDRWQHSRHERRLDRLRSTRVRVCADA